MSEFNALLYNKRGLAMSYMEQQMQQHIEAGEEKANELFKQMKRFEEFYLSLPDVDESLIKETKGYFDYVNDDAQFMWVCFREGAGV